MHTFDMCAGVDGPAGSAEGVLDPSIPETYTVLDALIKHVAELFPDDVIHLGGDEANIARCSSLSISQPSLATNHSTLRRWSKYRTVLASQP
jgi:N-acetyl-beta-hexosaminidase